VIVLLLIPSGTFKNKVVLQLYIKFTVAVSPIPQGGFFTYNTGLHFSYKTGWQFHVQHRVAVLRVTKAGRFTHNLA